MEISCRCLHSRQGNLVLTLTPGPTFRLRPGRQSSRAKSSDRMHKPIPADREMLLRFWSCSQHRSCPGAYPLPESSRTIRRERTQELASAIVLESVIRSRFNKG